MPRATLESLPKANAVCRHTGFETHIPGMSWCRWGLLIVRRMHSGSLSMT